MTISTQTSAVTAQGDGSNTTFAYAFLVPYQADGVTPAVSVYITVDDTNYILVRGTDFSITGVDDPAGGTVEYPLSGDPLALGATITISRALDYVQETELEDQGFRASQVEGALDTLEMQIQQAVALLSGQTAPTVVNSINGASGIVVLDTVETVQMPVFTYDTSLAVADGVGWVMVPEGYTSITLTAVACSVATQSSSGKPTVQLNSVATGNDILSTALTVDINEQSSFTASVPAVIDTAEATIAGGNLIRVDVDAAGTGTKGLTVALTWTVEEAA